MTKHVNEKDVAAMASYARIALDEQELSQMTADLNTIIESLKPITEFDLENVEPTFHPIGSLSNVMREDVPNSREFTQEQALSNAPSQQGGAFLIPSILGSGEN